MRIWSSRSVKKNNHVSTITKKNDDVPKMKRGRKKKEINPDEPPKVVRPRGRPKIIRALVESPTQQFY